MMEWCTQNGCVFNDWTFHYPFSGKIKVLKWLKSKDCHRRVLSNESYVRGHNVKGEVVTWYRRMIIFGNLHTDQPVNYGKFLKWVQVFPCFKIGNKTSLTTWQL